MQEVLSGRVEDDDGLKLSASSLTVTEGGSATYTVKLVTQPSGPGGDQNVKVTFAVTGDESVTVSPSSLTFTPGNYATAQTVTVSAAPDADEANGSGHRHHHRQRRELRLQPGQAARHRERHRRGGSHANANPHGNPYARAHRRPHRRHARRVRHGHPRRKRQPHRRHESRTGRLLRLHRQAGNSAHRRRAGQHYRVRRPNRRHQPQPVDAHLHHGQLEHSANRHRIPPPATSTPHPQRGPDDSHRKHRRPLGYYNLPWTWLRVNQVKAAALHISGRDLVRNADGANLTVTEGSSNTYRVRLNTKPAANVTVTIAEGEGNDDDLNLTASPDTLTFTPPTGTRRKP